MRSKTWLHRRRRGVVSAGMTAVFLLATICAGAASASCKDDNVTLQVLGAGGPELDDGRTSSSYLVWWNNRAHILVDVGSGSSVAFGRSKAKFADVKAILLTHLHVDHAADLPAFVKGAYFTERTQNLMIAGPQSNELMPSTSAYVSRLLGQKGAFTYLNEYIDKNTQSDYLIYSKDVPLKGRKPFTHQLDEMTRITAVPVDHGPVAAVAWRVDVANCSIAFTGDMTNKHGAFAKLAEGADIVVAHNAVPEDASEAALNLHMAPSEIGKLAHTTGTPHLILSHRMKRTSGNEIETMKYVRRHYSGNVSFAEDMSQFRVGVIDSEATAAHRSERRKE